MSRSTQVATLREVGDTVAAVVIRPLARPTATGADHQVTGA
ncbi:hypothetical protein [Saccharopolyspora gloriosae]|uniref:Uncharacterized protein n=1 Tax=Saccharopolyspora gloriosae TaxID=455344 RepID=A0A840NVQ7_9PSEU|nr:hypothetical protein [Saccharopolyspora gloriosae]MBB5072217.1 hypothetical protein [Saccharopolyspora gloriosae]